jgi:hypothetical protein
MDKSIHLAMSLMYLTDQSRNPIEVGQVIGNGLMTLTLQQGGHLVQSLLIAADSYHPGSLLAALDGTLPSDARGSAGDDDNLTLKRIR